jgi:TonB family protein
MRTTIGALAALLIAATAHAQAPPAAPSNAYRYVDEHGVIHWAQSLNLVPPAYASKAVTPDLRDESIFPSPKPYVKPRTPSMLAVTVDHKPRLESLHGWWAGEARRILTAAWKGRGQDGGQPVISFYVVRDGRLSFPDIERSSGDVAYDLKAKDTILNLRRLPPLPPDFTGTRLRVQLGFALVR